MYVINTLIGVGIGICVYLFMIWSRNGRSVEVADVLKEI
jgi:hypothetical protein